MTRGGGESGCEGEGVGAGVGVGVEVGVGVRVRVGVWVMAEGKMRVHVDAPNGSAMWQDPDTPQALRATGTYSRAHLCAVQSRLDELLLRVVLRSDEEGAGGVKHEVGALHHLIKRAFLQQVSLVQGQSSCGAKMCDTIKLAVEFGSARIEPLFSVWLA